MKTKLFLPFLTLVLCAALLLGCSPAASTPNNLVEYAVSVENDRLKPRGLEFGMTVEEVCKVKGMQSSDLQDIGSNTSAISRFITIEGLSDKVHENFTFYEGKLISAGYSVIVDETDFEALSAQVMGQAEEFLPEAMKDSDRCWIDSKGMGVKISHASTDLDKAPESICLDIYRIKPLLSPNFPSLE